MKYLTLKLAVIGTLGLASAQAMATPGFNNLPAGGFAVGSDTSPYKLCNDTGNFGSGSGANAPQKPTAGSHDECAVFPTSETATPIAGYSLVASATRSAVMNNTYTGGTNITVGTVTEYVWRKNTSGVYDCVYGAKVNLTNVDYNTTVAGTQNFEVNDIARGGFSGLTISAAYSTYPAVASPVYRIGRTYTSVQHRADASNNANPGPGYLAQPLTTPAPASTAAINGENTLPLNNTATAAQQTAALNDNWVDFTTDANFLDDDGSTTAASGMFYVQAACSSAAPSLSTATDAIRLRQTFQEKAGDGATANWFIEIPVTGFVPPGGSISPAHTNPF